MDEKIIRMLQNGNANVKLELSSNDLLAFSDILIARAKSELQIQMEDRKEEYFTRVDVKKLFGVCDATLWHWNRRGYLTSIKIGSKVRYRKSDIQKILDS